MPKIKSVTCHKAINSRGDWTISTKVTLDDGAEGAQTVPEGASKGLNEAIYIPADKAAEIVSTVINDALKDEDPFQQKALDSVLNSMDGTPNKSHLGGNSILSVSLAVAKAAACSQGRELFEYLGELYEPGSRDKTPLKFPTPLFNVLNGGKHAHNGLSVQEFMVIPSTSFAYDMALEVGISVYHELKARLQKEGLDTDVGDEGGFAPEGLTTQTALEHLSNAAGAKYKLGKDLYFGLDAAAGSFYTEGSYVLKEQGLTLSGNELARYYEKLFTKYDLCYLEDPFYEDDWPSWEAFFSANATKLLIVADDLVVTNAVILEKALKRNVANAVIVKPNQVGTLTETFAFIKLAKEHNLKVIVSHRSGDTAEDTFIADLSLAVSADYIKAGAPVRGERVAKYNRLLDIYMSTQKSGKD